MVLSSSFSFSSTLAPMFFTSSFFLYWNWISKICVWYLNIRTNSNSECIKKSVEFSNQIWICIYLEQIEYEYTYIRYVFAPLTALVVGSSDDEGVSLGPLKRVEGVGIWGWSLSTHSLNEVTSNFSCQGLCRAIGLAKRNMFSLNMTCFDM